jgi:hypothetical protein
MANRILYATQAVALAKTGHSNADAAEFHVMKGVQSVGLNTTFTLEQLFELGQVELYTNDEVLAECEATIEKVIDGERLLYLQAVGNVGKTNLVAAARARCDFYLAIYADTITSINGQSKTNTVMCSGMSVSNVSYNYSVDGPATESLSLVGNDKFWNNATYGILGSSPNTLWGTGGSSATPMDGTDVPASGVIRRGGFNVLASTLPAEVTSQVNDVPGSSGIQSISVSVDFGREAQNELGRFGPYAQSATFPIECTCEFEVTATNGDLVAISGLGPNLQNRTIILRDAAGTVINLGTKNKLTGTSYQGGDTGGGNATVTYSYSTFSDFRVDGGGTYW